MSKRCSRLFGTDGIRGIANREPVTAETALKLGRAAAHFFKTLKGPADRGRHQIVIGKDTRLSGYMLENAMVAGITSMGVDVLLVGPLPTPGVAYITRSLRCDAGVVLTASHNAFEDNGIKFFRHDGYKLDDRVEDGIEELMTSGRIDGVRPTAKEIGKAKRIDDALGRYIEFVKSSIPRGMSLEGFRIVVDVAHGAAYKSSPCILRELGAEVIVLNNAPDGTNINVNCGSIVPQVVAQAVKDFRADLGISHDGDGDRVVLTDEKGNVIEGEIILAMVALSALRSGELRHRNLVTTIVSNLALDTFIERAGGKVVRTPVGDRYVIEKMLELDANFGGEPSGHFIFRDHGTTGDGIVSALQILKLMKESEKSLSEMAQGLKLFPQVQRNLRVRSKPPLEEMPEVQELVREVEASMGNRGRVLLRYSGTEPKMRLLVEGEDLPTLELHATKISQKIKETIGA